MSRSLGRLNSSTRSIMDSIRFVLIMHLTQHLTIMQLYDGGCTLLPGLERHFHVVVVSARRHRPTSHVQCIPSPSTMPSHPKSLVTLLHSLNRPNHTPPPHRWGGSRMWCTGRRIHPSIGMSMSCSSRSSSRLNLRSIC